MHHKTINFFSTHGCELSNHRLVCSNILNMMNDTWSTMQKDDVVKVHNFVDVEMCLLDCLSIVLCFEC